MLKPGTAEYYREALCIISAIGIGYDGYDPKSGRQMKGLVDDLLEIARKALKHKPLYKEV